MRVQNIGKSTYCSREKPVIRKERQKMTIIKTSLLVAVVITNCLGAAVAQELDAADLKAMRDAADSYAGAWLTNDADTVMATFVDEPVLSPSELPYLEGQDAARAFWFPADAPPTKVTEFTTTEIEISGSGDLGYVRGTFRLIFEYDGNNYENNGKYVTILRKSAGGVWRITHHIWDDFPRSD
jgi:ketosteroid isomerase-like protein